jgi:hypothetical protein
VDADHSSAPWILLTNASKRSPAVERRISSVAWLQSHHGVSDELMALASYSCPIVVERIPPCFLRRCNSSLWRHLSSSRAG